MIRINETFELDFDGMQWLLYQYRPAVKRDPETNKNTGPTYMKRTGPKFYSRLVSACGSIIDTSAGKACSDAVSILDAIKQAKSDIHRAICGGGWK